MCPLQKPRISSDSRRKGLAIEVDLGGVQDVVDKEAQEVSMRSYWGHVGG